MDSTWQERTVARAYNAHSNHWEAFTGFAVAMILALINNVKEQDLAPLANAFLFVRVIYNIVYILAFNIPLSGARSAIFSIGIILIFRIFSLAVGAELLTK